MLNTGKVAIPIEFDNGDVQNIYFNPSDPNLFIRMKDFEKRLKERISKIDDIEISANGKPSHEKDIEAFVAIQNAVCEELNATFDSNISDIAFKHCSPFALVDGNFFVLNFIEYITPKMTEHIEKEKSRATEAMEKHIAKYRK